MKRQNTRNESGSTLIEALIAIVILTIGIFAAIGMHVTALNASSSSYHRTNANNVAISLLETLKNLDFDDPILNETTPSPGVLVNDGNDIVFTTVAFPEMATIINEKASAPPGTVTDNSNFSFVLSWDVQDRKLPTSGESISKTIRVYMTWNTLMGQNRLQMTTVKYNNVSLEI